MFVKSMRWKHFLKSKGPIYGGKVKFIEILRQTGEKFGDLKEKRNVYQGRGPRSNVCEKERNRRSKHLLLVQ